MSTVLYVLVPLAILAVAVVLGLGLRNMLRDGGGETSQNLMRWRVVLQFAAVILLLTAAYFIRG